MTPRGRLLVVDDDDQMRLLLEEELVEAGYQVHTAAGGGEALERLATEAIDVVVTDLVMAGMRGSELLSESRARHPEIPVVIITAFGSIESAVEAIQAGAYHYVAKPFRTEQLLVTVENAMRERDLRREIRSLRETLGAGAPRIIAASPPMRRAVDLVQRAAAAASPVLLLGESGTGKEVLARALHAASPRGDKPFLAINCSAIPETLLESQLFGHRRGSFTDAREDRRGLFQEAEGGSIFLDEIGDMPVSLQSKLLRVLQEKEVQPIGAPAPLPIDIRVIAATHRDLEAFVVEGRFRQDLFYRLNVIAIRIPPLRDRPEDIVPLVAHFLEKHRRRLGRSECSLAPGAMQAIRGHSWPGNVRELENAIERALVLGQDDVIWPEDLPEQFRKPPVTGSPERDPRAMADVERDHIERTLRSVRGNKAAAARILGLDRKTLYRKIDLYGLSQR